MRYRKKKKERFYREMYDVGKDKRSGDLKYIAIVL